MGSIRKSKTKRRTRDIDQVHADLRSARHLELFKETKLSEDLPALGEYFCVQCAKWFESDHNLIEHRRGKRHKRRVRVLKETPHTQREAEAATGLGVDNGRRKEADIAESEEVASKSGPAEMQVDPLQSQ